MHLPMEMDVKNDSQYWCYFAKDSTAKVVFEARNHELLECG